MNNNSFAHALGQRDAELKLHAAQELGAEYPHLPDWVQLEIEQAFIKGCVFSATIDAASNHELMQAMPHELIRDLLREMLEKMPFKELMQLIMEARQKTS